MQPWYTCQKCGFGVRVCEVGAARVVDMYFAVRCGRAGVGALDGLCVLIVHACCFRPASAFAMLATIWSHATRCSSAGRQI